MQPSDGAPRDSGSLRRFAAACLVLVAVCVGVRIRFVEPLADLPLAPPAAAPAAAAPVRKPPVRVVPPAQPALPAVPAANGDPQAKPFSNAEDFWSRESIQALLTAKGDVNVRAGADGKTPLLYAASSPAMDLVDPLVAAGADPLVRDYLGRDAVTRLMERWAPGYLARVEAILARLRPRGDHPVIDPSRAVDPAWVARWLATGPDLEARDDLARTPLLWAVYLDAEPLALALIERGARLDAVDYRGHTPLHFAAMNGNLALARRFVSAGADLDRANDYGQTPLALSLYAPDTRMLQYLLAQGADPCIGPRGRGDLLDLTRGTLTGNEAAAIALLEPAVRRRACAVSPEQARRANAREFTARLRELTPPPEWVMDPSIVLPALARGEDLIAATEHYYNRSQATSSREEYDSLVRERSAIGYRALLEHPDDASFANVGALVWSWYLEHKDPGLDLELRALQQRHFFYEAEVEPCPLCDPGEHTKGQRAMLYMMAYAEALLSRGRVLPALDILEKFERERIHETSNFRAFFYENLVRYLWLLGRRQEAHARGEAWVRESEGSYPSKDPKNKNRLEYILGHMRDAEAATPAAKTTARRAR